MPALTDAPSARIEHDATSQVIRSWFGSVQGAQDKAHVRPRDVGYSVLRDNAHRFKWSGDLKDLREGAILNGVGAHSARWYQVVDGIPVDASEIVVNMYDDGTVHSVYNNYHYEVPAGLVPESIEVTVKAARATAVRALIESKPAEPELPSLLIYRYHRIEHHPPKPTRANGSAPSRIPAKARAAMDAHGGGREEGRYYLVWDVRIITHAPLGNWRVLVDARTGSVLDVIDLAQHATGAGRVYDPNPVVTSGNAALAPGTAAATLDTMTSAIVVDRLNGPDGGGKLHLDGSFVHMEELEAPTFAEPASALGDFIFSTGDRSFLDVMAYFHIDRFQHYVQSVLGLTNVANFSIGVDPQGYNGADNSHYLSASKVITFGEGGGVPDAADAMVILHEYGHAIQDNVNPGFNNPVSGVGEGFGDFLSAVFYDLMHANLAATRGWMMSWDARGGWGGRRYDRTYRFDDPQYTGQGDNHLTGELWCTVMFELYRKLGGDSQWYPDVRAAARDLAIRLHLMANFHVPAAGATAAQMGQQVEAADLALGGWKDLADGLHRKVIYDTFARRHLAGYPATPVDVYVNDGREGGYGSTSGQDLFGEVLWQDNYWETQDIWVRSTPYPSAAAQQAGGPGDHVEPAVGSPAYLYTRVKNRGTDAAGSGAVTVRAFNSDPGIGLVWPDDWSEMDASAAVPVTNVLPGPSNGVVAGPFEWTPTVVGHECVLVVLEHGSDRAVTQDLAGTAHVRHSDLVPFDNNIAQRNLVPTSAKRKMIRGFWLRNPDEVVRHVQLHVQSTLPRGWSWSLGRVNTESIRLAPLERVWIGLTIAPDEGTEVGRVDSPMRLTVSGTIEGRLIGGMTFYAAPESAFGTPPRGDDDEDCEPTDGEVTTVDRCAVSTTLDGELVLRIRFNDKS